MVFLRHSASGNRRGAERVPVHLASSFKLGGETIEASVLDLSAHGALLRAPADLKAPQNLSLKIAGLGSVFAQVVGVSELGAHLRFTSLEPAVSKRIVDAIEAAKRRYEPFIRRAQWAAGDVAQAFEHGVAHGEVLMEELITTEYTPIFGTNPIQYETPAIRFYQKTLPPIMEQHRQSADRPLFVMPSDRNAYLPVHHPEFSLPQRQGDTAWNDLNCRDRRLMDRWMTLIGARNKAPYHLRVYARHGREGQVVPILMISCPVFVNGELWGNVQSGFAIDTAPVS
jgi:methyl-accepting chemotaxis protein